MGSTWAESIPRRVVGKVTAVVTGIVPERYQPRGDAPNVYPRPGHPAVGGRMAHPILRLATRITRRTRGTAVAIALDCMVLVRALRLAYGLANGIASVADRIAAGPQECNRGDERPSSDIDLLALRK